MVQHANRLHQVEAAAKPTQRHDVGLGIFDRCQTELPRLVIGIAQTVRTEIDRQYPGFRKALRGFDGMLTGTAAGDENFELPLFASRVRDRKRKSAMQISGETVGTLRWRSLDPARIRIFL